MRGGGWRVEGERKMGEGVALFPGHLSFYLQGKIWKWPGSKGGVCGDPQERDGLVPASCHQILGRPDGQC